MSVRMNRNTGQVNRKLLIVVAVLAVLTVGTLAIVGRNSQDADKAENRTPRTSANAKEFDELDKKKVASMKGVLQAIAFTYTNANQPYPDGTPQGWEDIMSTVQVNNSFVDPYTDTVYTFASKDPEVGQLQYKPASGCNKDGKDFVADSKFGGRIIAVRGKLSTGYRCVSNL